MIRIGADVARPDGYRTAVVKGDDPFERAAAIDRFVSAARGRALGRRGALLGASSPEWAMPAAAWAARSGDAALPVQRGLDPGAGAARAGRARAARTSTCSAPSA